MTPTVARLALAAPGDASGLAAFLARQLRWDKAAAARLTASGEVLAAFTRPARFGVVAVRTVRLREAARLDVTVAAGELLEGIDEERALLAVPGPVTGPAWAGVLPPRGGWRTLAEPSHEQLRSAAAAVIAEFRRRSAELAQGERTTREALEALAEELWSRTLPGTPLPLRVVHAAHALGFLPAAPAPAPAAPAAPRESLEGIPVLVSDGWLRLRTPLGSVAVRRAAGPGLSLTPVRQRQP